MNFEAATRAATRAVELSEVIYEKGSQEDALPLAAFFCRL